MASDSRTTNPDFTVRDDAQKIRIMQMADSNTALIGQSGDDSIGARVVERIIEAGSLANLLDWQSVSDIGNKIILEEQRKLKEPYLGPGYTLEAFRDILMDIDSSFMIAHYFKGKPYIHTANFYPGIFSPENRTFVSIGCGAPIANFLMDGFDFSQLTQIAATAALIYVIEEVKTFDPRCGGPTRIAWSTPIPLPDKQFNVQTGAFNEAEIQEFLDKVNGERAKIKRDWNKKMKRIMTILVNRKLEKVYGKAGPRLK